MPVQSGTKKLFKTQEKTALRKVKFKTINREEHTFPLEVSESCRVHVLVRLMEPSLKDLEILIVAVECMDN